MRTPTWPTSHEGHAQALAHAVLSGQRVAVVGAGRIGYWRRVHDRAVAIVEELTND